MDLVFCFPAACYKLVHFITFYRTGVMRIEVGKILFEDRGLIDKLIHPFIHCANSKCIAAASTHKSTAGCE